MFFGRHTSPGGQISEDHANLARETRVRGSFSGIPRAGETKETRAPAT
jgi:hypothetical protein